MNNNIPTTDEETIRPIERAELPSLIRLPNGSWVRPDIVTAIRPLMTEEGIPRGLHRARVVVHHGSFYEILLANDDEHAQAIADELAGVVSRELSK